MTRETATSSHMRPAAIPAWGRLQAALMSAVPDCEGDDRYIADAADLPREDRAVMAAICTACPLHTPCGDYATADRPRAGWWPGHNLTPSQKGTPRG